ncbi:MAG TPA: hypothetical protein VK645_15670 [Chitinophagaceae bacterium]|nr:hypothetical protein [Chitinophagaceae bacterium]
MIKLGGQHFNFDETRIPDFVESVTNHQFGKKIILKDKYASGDYKLLEFQNGFYAYASNYILNEDFELELSVAKEEYVALHINQIQAGAECKICLNHKAVSYDDKIITSIFLTVASDSFILSGTSGACVNRLKIMVPKTWIAKNLPFFNETLLKTYLELGEERLFYDAMDNTYRSLVDEVMNTEDHAFYLSITQHIVAVITERFFNRLKIKLQKNQQGNEWSGRVA